LDSWRDFSGFITEYMLEYGGNTIWRGQSNAGWPLQTSFDRAVLKCGEQPTEDLAQRHLDRFKRATRGRRTPSSRPMMSEDDWWTLGQHYGLATPMLDWTYSPYVALYFAYLDAECTHAAGLRSVWGLYLPSCVQLNRRAGERAQAGEYSPGLQMMDPLVDENARLVNQNGVFTRLAVDVTIDSWVRDNVSGEGDCPLVKVLTPSTGREDCLRHLNQMNINHVSLFPDLDGSSRHCNHQLTIRNY
jgi:hypothetical protein